MRNAMLLNQKFDTIVRNSFVFNNTFDKTYYIILSFFILNFIIILRL